MTTKLKNAIEDCTYLCDLLICYFRLGRAFWQGSGIDMNGHVGVHRRVASAVNVQSVYGDFYSLPYHLECSQV